ncbi:kinase-like domain-containing protein [Rhizophagus clarus]|uniref:Kinase-like domain-containing protein n=1 Tax=Rhizophagus clarus TaxID=94130 RepID=A0A8H3QHS3_9GLOM|nr:kinase-like domain-containing protein [Rhizophagus clarus]
MKLASDLLMATCLLECQNSLIYIFKSKKGVTQVTVHHGEMENLFRGKCIKDNSCLFKYSFYIIIKVNIGRIHQQNMQLKFDKDKISILKEIINEINLMRIVSNPKIIQFYGVTKLTDELSLVLEYADGGTLGKYLRDNATILIKWETQLKFVNEITAATSWLHFKKIVHGI